MAKGFKSDPGLFRKLSEPCTKEVAQLRCDEFAKAIVELREKYMIPNMVCVIGMNYTSDDPSGDGESRNLLIVQRGDFFQNALLTAMASGSLQTAITEELATATSRGRKMAQDN